MNILSSVLQFLRPTKKKVFHALTMEVSIALLYLAVSLCLEHILIHTTNVVVGLTGAMVSGILMGFFVLIQIPFYPFAIGKSAWMTQSCEFFGSCPTTFGWSIIALEWFCILYVVLCILALIKRAQATRIPDEKTGTNTSHRREIPFVTNLLIFLFLLNSWLWLSSLAAFIIALLPHKALTTLPDLIFGFADLLLLGTVTWGLIKHKSWGFLAATCFFWLHGFEATYAFFTNPLSNFLRPIGALVDFSLAIYFQTLLRSSNSATPSTGMNMGKHLWIRFWENLQPRLLFPLLFLIFLIAEKIVRITAPLHSFVVLSGATASFCRLVDMLILSTALWGYLRGKRWGIVLGAVFLWFHLLEAIAVMALRGEFIILSWLGLPAALYLLVLLFRFPHSRQDTTVA